MANGIGYGAALGGGLGVLDIGLNMWAQNSAELNKYKQWNQEVAGVQRQNQRQALMIKEANRRTADIYEYQTDRFKQNLGFIKDDYYRAGEDLQRELQGAFAQSAYSRQSQLAALAKATGFNAAASEGYSRSRERADLLGTVGTFGRNQAMEAERLAGVVAQTDRNKQALGRQAKQTVFNQWGDLGITPELQKYYGQETPIAPQKMNSALAGFQALSSGLGTAISTFGSLAKL